MSPALEWTGSPGGTRSFALLCNDPDAPGGTWHHWAVYDIPADVGRLDEAFAASAGPGAAKEGVNDFGQIGYGGPCPPRRHGPHHYFFRLFALDVERLEVGPKPTCTQVEAAAAGHARAEAQLVGIFAR